MGIFTKSKAPEPVPEEKLVSEMTAPELRDRLEKLREELAQFPDEGMEWSAVKFKIREADDFLALATRSIFTQGQHQILPKFYANCELVRQLANRARAIDLDENWLPLEAEKVGANIQTLEGYTAEVQKHLETELAKFEAAAKKKPRKSKAKTRASEIENYPGPIAICGMKAIPFGDGTYSHCTSTDEVDNLDYPDDETAEKYWKSLIAWSESLGINSTTVFAHYGPIKSRHGSKTRKEQFAILQAAIAHIVQDEKKKGAKVGIFKKTTDVRDDGNVANTETGEVIQQSAAVATETANDNFEDWTIKDEVRGRMGYNRKQIEIKSKEDMEYWMRRRMNIVLELQYIMKQFDTVYAELQADITQFDEDFLGLFESWARTNHPPKEDAKTAYKGLFGQLSFRNAPQYIKLDENNESLLRAKLHQIYETDKVLAARLGIEQKIDYNRDLDKVKPWAVEQGIAEKIGFTITPPVTDKFFIAPSIDTVKRNLREELKRAK